VAEGERAQEGPDGGGGHDPVAQDRPSGPAAQHVDVVDAVAAGQHAVHQRQQLGARVGRAGPGQAEQLVSGEGDVEPGAGVVICGSSCASGRRTVVVGRPPRRYEVGRHFRWLRVSWSRDSNPEPAVHKKLGSRLWRAGAYRPGS
jgi:hypothetical protein